MHTFNQLPPHFETLLQSHHVTPQTRAVLEERLMHPEVAAPHYSNETQFATLKAVCARLIPQPANGPQVDLPGLLDERIAKGESKGWRYDALPPDAELFRDSMDKIEAVAQALCGNTFLQSDASRQDDVLRLIQAGDISESLWLPTHAQRFFEELLAALAAIYYSHPLAKAAIGDESFADEPGWTAIGLDEREPLGAL